MELATFVVFTASVQHCLRATEQEIERRNLSRIPYDTLLPSSIPQSINL